MGEFVEVQWLTLEFFSERIDAATDLDDVATSDRPLHKAVAPIGASFDQSSDLFVREGIGGQLSFEF